MWYCPPFTTWDHPTVWYGPRVTTWDHPTVIWSSCDNLRPSDRVIWSSCYLWPFQCMIWVVLRKRAPMSDIELVALDLHILVANKLLHCTTYLYIISEEASIFAPQRLRFYRALGVAACTVGKVRASTVFMCVCSMFRPSDFLLFVKNGFVVGVRCQGNREPPADGATTPLSQRHAWLALPKQ